ncbi:hypothetical protein HYH03_007159 [Edaphochlamys debaryana]|uniref:Protein kinase domain-containing protein n=1 Tax=Edaphochlamys debaryana TaxID=47281 RepID=A0A835Y2B7_9CHLO|nr:hypothetical protein HYH03_007159 [Edaphochlamys debaryana]|eukprot:KAG2494641.1 hypothetical protein HYH03_007159 [Edaphochlamys debaryana]
MDGLVSLSANSAPLYMFHAVNLLTGPGTGTWVLVCSGGPGAHTVPVGLQLPGVEAADCTGRSTDLESPLRLPLGPQKGTEADGLSLRTLTNTALPLAGPLPPCWDQVLSCIQTAVGGSSLGAAVLVPLVFGARRVGAMLLVLPQQGGPSARAPLALGAAGALEALGACVAECCLGPALPAMEQIAASAAAVASAASLSELATALTSSLSSALTAELHVDLTVRLAVLPYKDASAGVLFSPAADGCASRTGMLQPQSPKPCASPRLPASRSVLGLASQVREAHAARAAGPSSSQSTWLSQSPFRSSMIHAATSGGCAAGADEFDNTEAAHMPQASASRRGTQTGLVKATGSLAASVSPAAIMTGAEGIGTSMALEHLLATGRQEARLRPLASGPLASPVPSSLRVAWKAYPFTSCSTLLAALLSGRAGAEVGLSASQLASAFTSGGSAAHSGGVAQMVGASLRAAPVGSSSLGLRAQMIPDVPAFLHSFDHPSEDVFALVRRAGATGGLDALVTIAATWTGPCASLLLSTGSHDGSPMTSELGEAARIPALGVYISSTMSLPPSLLMAARDKAAGLLKVVASAVIRSLTCGRVADQWALLAGQVTAGGGATAAAHWPVGVSVGGLPSGAGGNGVMGSSPAVSSAVQAFIVDAGADAFQPLATITSASGPIPADLMRSQEASEPLVVPEEKGASLPSLINTDVPAARGGGGDSSPVPAARSLGASRLMLSSRALLSSHTHNQVASASFPPSASAGRITNRIPHRSEQPVQPLAKSMVMADRSVPSSSVAPRHNTLGASGSGAASPVGAPTAHRRCLRSFLSFAHRRGSVDDDRRDASPAAASRAAVSHSGAAEAVDDLEAMEAEALGMIADTAAAQGAVVRQHQMATLVTAFTTTLARSRPESDTTGSSHAEADIRALAISRPLGQGSCSVVMLGRLHAMPVAVKVLLPLDEEPDAGADGPAGHQVYADQASPDSQQPPLMCYISFNGAAATNSPVEAKPAQALAAAAARCPTLRRRQRLQALMRGARELAVLTSISHPNIVQVGAGGRRGLSGVYGRVMVVGQGGRKKLAVLTSISHPNIMQVYSYCTRVVVEEPEPTRPRLRVVPEGAEAQGLVCSVLIMEFCDMGSLADAIDSGMFARAAKRAAGARTQGFVGGQPSPAAAAAAGTPAMRAVYLTLLEVALALRHLHSMNLVHCDVKPANVLLRSSATDPRGFTAKLTDFGFVNLASSQTGREDGGNAKDSPHQDPVGTVTHMAPELFANGGTVDWSIDCYAFGILMWETYTGWAPYPDFAHSNFREVPDKVSKEGLRPRFPAETPRRFQHLAAECWSASPSQRPTAASLVVRLQALLDASCGNV